MMRPVLSRRRGVPHQTRRERTGPAGARGRRSRRLELLSQVCLNTLRLMLAMEKVIEARQSGVPVKYNDAPTGSIVVKRLV